jgi:hypothetical protein
MGHRGKRDERDERSSETGTKARGPKSEDRGQTTEFQHANFGCGMCDAKYRSLFTVYRLTV